MTTNETDQDSAAHWAIRIDSGAMEPSERAELDIWLNEDERRIGALLRAQAVLSYLDKGRALGVGTALGDASMQQVGRTTFLRPNLPVGNRFIGASIAASLLAVVAIGSLYRPATLQPVTETAPVTIAQETRNVDVISLADGSIAHVKSGGVLKIAMTRDQRSVALEKGEAWFKVQHDKTRPFVVSAGDVRIRAVGTAFSVRLLADGADISVTEGVVETWVAGNDQARTRMGSGTTSFVRNALPAPSLSQPARNAAATPAVPNAPLALNGESVAYAVGEMNKRNSTKLVIGNPDVGRQPLVGLFRTDSPAEFAEAIASVTGAQVTHRDGAIHIEK